MPDQETGYAKVNLALHVRERLANGYHRLETLFVFAEDGDALTGVLADDLTLTIAGPFSAGLDAGADNLVMKAAYGLQAAFGVQQGARITLEKRLPVAAGIGGGSADAAAAIRLLCGLWGLDRRDERVLVLAERLGADVPACIESVTVRGEGVGERLLPVDGAGLSGLPILLANPLVACPTGPVFKGWDGVDRGPLVDDCAIGALRAARNDLQRPAIALVPEIATLLDQLACQSGVALTRMSGSGATCFALFEDDAARDAAAAALSPCWTLATRLR